MFPAVRYIHQGFNPFSIVLTAQLYNYRRKRKFWHLGIMFGPGIFFGGGFLLEVVGFFQIFDPIRRYTPLFKSEVSTGSNNK